MRWPIGQPPFQWSGEINRTSPQAHGLTSLFHPLMHWRDLIGGYQMTPVGNAAANGVNAQIGHTYSLDGTDDCAYVTLPDAWKLQQFTISAWIKPMATGFNMVFSTVPRGAAADGRGTMLLLSSYQLYLAIGNGTAYTYSNLGAYMSAGATYHVAGTYNGANMIVYINGRQDSIKAATVTISYADKSTSHGPNPASAYIGGYHSAINSSPGTTADILYDFNGQIGPVSLYNRALSAAEVWSLYDPQTRWQLYATPEYRRWFVPVVSGGIIPRVRHHMVQQGMA